jgi:hypothetical protein
MAKGQSKKHFGERRLFFSISSVFLHDMPDPGPYRSRGRVTMQMRSVVRLVAVAFILSASPAAAQTSGFQAGLTIGSAPGPQGYDVGFITGWYGTGENALRKSPVDVLAELVVGARNFDDPAFFGRGALLLRFSPNAGDRGPGLPTRVHFLIGPQLEWRRGTGDVLSRTGIKPDMKLVLGGEIGIRGAFVELRYTADLSSRTRVTPSQIEVTRSGPRLVPPTSRKEFALANGAVMLTVGMRLK